MIRTVMVAIGALVFTCSTVRAQQVLDDAQIMSLLSGKSAMFNDLSYATYGADGSYTYVAANNLYFRGRYTTTDGKLCVALDGGKKQCDTVAIDTISPYLKTGTGQLLRFGVRAAMTPQHTAKLCGVEVAYNVYPPAVDVTGIFAKFSGVWVGKWDYGMCAAMIVESVDAAGVATVIYINGDYRSFKPGSLRFRGHIVENTLTDGGVNRRFDAILTNPSEISATRTGPPDNGTARFRKQP